MEKVLQVNGLTKLYKNRRGIEGISFEISRGEVFGFLGPNGAGKTTAMKTITGLCRADSGEVAIFGHDTVKSYEKAMKKVGCIIGGTAAYSYLNAYGNLELAARFHEGIGRDRVREVLELTGLTRYANDKAAHYSAGMKLRLALAMAIVAEPELVILDEPANGLDIEGVYDIRNIIRELAQKKGTSFFISSHLIHEIQLICDRIGILNEGRLMGMGNVNEILDTYSSLEDYFIKQVREKGGNKVS